MRRAAAASQRAISTASDALGQIAQQDGHGRAPAQRAQRVGRARSSRCRAAEVHAARQRADDLAARDRAQQIPDHGQRPDTAATRSSYARRRRGAASSFSVAAAAEDQPDRRALEAEGLAQPILQEAFVPEVDQLGVVDEEDEGRRVGIRLRDVAYLQQLTLCRPAAGASRSASWMTALSRAVGMRFSRSSSMRSASPMILWTRCLVLAETKRTGT